MKLKASAKDLGRRLKEKILENKLLTIVLILLAILEVFNLILLRTFVVVGYTIHDTGPLICIGYRTIDLTLNLCLVSMIFDTAVLLLLLGPKIKFKYYRKELSIKFHFVKLDLVPIFLLFVIGFFHYLIPQTFWLFIVATYDSLCMPRIGQPIGEFLCVCNLIAIAFLLTYFIITEIRGSR